jgi:hypothetical protein
VLTVSGLKRDTARQGAAYNLSIQGIHTYHVGDNEILVHNMCTPGGAAETAGAAGSGAASSSVLTSVSEFTDGGLFEATVASPAGNVGVLAETTISGSTLTLSDVAVYGESGPFVGQVGAGTLLRARTAVVELAARQGFETLRITGVRVPGSSALKPGTIVDWTLNLGRYGD